MKVVIFNNRALAFVQVEIMAAGVVPFATDLHNPDLRKPAEARVLFGVHVATVVTPETLRPTLAPAFAHGGPALVKALVQRQGPSLRPTITFDQARRLGRA